MKPFEVETLFRLSVTCFVPKIIALQLKCRHILDDILLLAPSVGELHNLLARCEVELDPIDMAINIKKSCCMRIGPRNHVCCASISCASGIALGRRDKIFGDFYCPISSF